MPLLEAEFGVFLELELELSFALSLLRDFERGSVCERGIPNSGVGSSLKFFAEGDLWNLEVR